MSILIARITTASTRTGNSAALHCLPVMQAFGQRRMYNRIRLHVRQLSIIAVLLSTLSSGCTHELTRFVIDSGDRPPYVPEIDNYIINLEGIERTSSPEDVRAILGEPPFVIETHGGGEHQWTTWRYPIRSIGAVPLPAGAKTQRQVIPAPELRVRLDASGRVEAWGFYHPISKSPIRVSESIEQADARLAKACSPPARIELGEVLKEGTPKEVVLNRMRWFEGLLVSTEFERSQVRVSLDGQKETLIYYTDHPSPLYVPPSYVVVTFYSKGNLGTRWHFEGWDGCK
jgi:hypothetical protein